MHTDRPDRPFTSPAAHTFERAHAPTFVRVLTLALLIAASLLFAPATHAQCDPVWQPFDAHTATHPGTDQPVYAMTLWDPDGPGPDSSKLVIAGEFSLAGSVMVLGIALYDPITGEWSSLGSTATGQATCLAVLPNGDLIAGGILSSTSGRECVARWNPSTEEWTILGSASSTTSRIFTLAVLPDGDVVAGGVFTAIGGVPANNIARWDSQTGTWSAMGSGTSNTVYALKVLPNGDLLAGGTFSMAGGQTVRRIARWNSESGVWSPLGSGIDSPAAYVYALEFLPNGDVVAGGAFTSAGGVPANRIARWSAETGLWSPMGAGTSNAVYALQLLPSGDLVAGGRFNTSEGAPGNHIARWSDTTGQWTAMGSGSSYPVHALAVLPGGDVVAGGEFNRAGDAAALHIARWSDSAHAWSALGKGLNNSVLDLAALPNGDVIVGGYFTSAGEVRARRIARWNSLTGEWAPVGSGIDGDFSEVTDVAVLPNGDIVAAGDFTSAGGVSANRIARWNGSAWSALGSGILATTEPITTMAALPNGDLVVGGNFTTIGGVSANRIARWDGSSWSALGSGMSGGSVSALAVLPDGSLIAAGSFTSAGGVAANRVAKWDGSTWSALGPGIDDGYVLALAVLPNDDIIAGGSFFRAGGVTTIRIARWDSDAQVWTALGSGIGMGVGTQSVHSLAVLPNGNLVAGGRFYSAGGLPLTCIARWDGASWSAMESGILPLPVVVNGVYAMTILPNGDLIVGGQFAGAGGVVTPHLARWGPPRIFITQQPNSNVLQQDQSVTLHAAINPGLSDVSVQWQRDGVDITDGPGGASPGGGAVTGASGTLFSPTTTEPISLTITGAQVSDSGAYTAVFSSACDSATSASAAITVSPLPCLADFNADTEVDILDLLDFIDAFGACENQPAPCPSDDVNADVNGDTSVDILDFLDFIDAFSAGACP